MSRRDNIDSDLYIYIYVAVQSRRLIKCGGNKCTTPVYTCSLLAGYVIAALVTSKQNGHLGFGHFETNADKVSYGGPLWTPLTTFIVQTLLKIKQGTHVAL